MENKVLELIDMLKITSTTEARFKESFQLMLAAKSITDATNFRFELGGMLSSLEAESVITTAELENINKAIGTFWKAKSRAFYFTERAIEKAQKA